MRIVAGVMVLMFICGVAAPRAQAPAPAPAPAGSTNDDPVLPADYVIGPEDVLSIVFWRDADMTADVVVRPDGKITLPLINDIHAAGLRPEELGRRVTEAAGKLIESPNVMVRVREIKSRKVFITGMVANPAHYPLTAPTTVLQLIASAGGLLEYAKTKDIRIIRTENDRQVAHRFNYNDVMQGKNLNQNIELKPGDTVIVP
jgi:polysaccharide export outer membrane protein